MKIDPILNSNILRTYKVGRSAPTATNPSTGRDEVTFSSEALSFSKVMAEVEFRTKEERAHISDISNAVKQGEYKVDSEDIADKILESVLRR